jgi:hypothetical protein
MGNRGRQSEFPARSRANAKDGKVNFPSPQPSPRGRGAPAAVLGMILVSDQFRRWLLIRDSLRRLLRVLVERVPTGKVKFLRPYR